MTALEEGGPETGGLADRPRYRLFGGLAVDGPDGPLDLGGPKQRAVLSSLLEEPGHALSPGRLIDQVWGDDAPTRAETSLQAYVSNLRRVLEPNRKPREAPTLLVTVPAGYAMLVDPNEVDIVVFEGIAASGHRLLQAGDPAAAADLLDDALSRWTGPPLPELAGEPWVVELTARLSQVRARAVEDRYEAGLALGDHELLVPRIERSVSEEPFRERLRGQLALALYRSGRQRDALAALNAAREALIEEAGLELGPELRRLEGEILEQSPALDPPARGVAPAMASPVHTAAELAAARVAPGSVDERASGSLGSAGGSAGRMPARSSSSDRPFVGRSTHLGALVQAYEQAARGAGRPVVVRGEPGIGKTRLVEEFVAQVPEAVVAWGRCPESAGASAFWPCIQIGRQLEGAGVVDGDLAALLTPPRRVPGESVSGDDVAGGNAGDVLTLHMSIAKLLASVKRPLVLVVDDLHWADPASLRVLEFVASELRASPTLMIVTTRPVGSDATSALIDCLGELARQPGMLNLELGGLSTAEVESWFASRTGMPGGTGIGPFAELVHDRTGGNAFFVGEVVEMIATEQPSGGVTPRQIPRVPAAVQDVIRRRVGRLPGASQTLLVSASVIGRTFDLDVLAAISDASPLDVLEGLEPSLDAGLLAGTDAPARFQFAHALVADTLEAELSRARRARLHAAIATALESLRTANLDDHAAELAHHAFEGAAAGTAEQAAEWSVHAARLATARLAFEDAATLWDLAARSLELARPADRGARCDALLDRAGALLAADDVTAAYETLVQAIDLAIDVGDVDRVGRAAAAANVEGLWMAGEVGAVGAEIVGALERALAVMASTPSANRSLALGALAENVYWSRSVDAQDQLTAEAIEVARVAGDDVALGRALQKRTSSLWFAATLDERRAAADELLDLSERAAAEGRPLPGEVEAIAGYCVASVAWEAGDVDTAATHVAGALPIAHRTGSPALITQLGFFESAILVWRGRFDEAATAIDGAYGLYRRTRRWSADTYRVGFIGQVWLERDRLDLILEHADALLAEPYGPWFGQMIGFALAENGRLDEAADLVEPIPPLLDCWMYMGVVVAAAHTRVTLGDTASCEVLRDQLRPYVGRIGSPGTGPAWGDVALALARMEHLLGNPEEARRLADFSVDLTTRTGAGPWRARSLLFRHELTGDEADRSAAARLVDEFGLELLRKRL